MSKFLLLTLVLLAVASAGATGAYMMSDGLEWQGGHFGMMGDDSGEVPCEAGSGPEDCPYEDLMECEEHEEECEESSYQGCPYNEDTYSRQRGGGCC